VPSVAALVSILFDGFSYAMVLFIISVGLSITMGLMGFVNLAHGAFAMAGGYLVVALTRSLGVPFLPSLVIAAVVVGAASIPFERVLYSRLYHATELDQVLLTIGLASMSVAVCTLVYGPAPITVPLPSILTGQIDIGVRTVPAYRAFVIAVGVVLIAVLWFAFERTNIGAKIRAAVDNRKMAQSVGINVDRLFTMTFAVGSGLAAFGGALAIQTFGLTPSFALLYLVFFLLIVSVGGLGSLKGTLVASILLGVFDIGGKYLTPEAGGFFIYALALLILLVKPAGLYGRE
jgi:branched-chain amino acid transport system permease protein